MTTEFEHQEELETVLTEEPTGEPTPAPEAEVEKLGEAAVSLEWLVSLQRTISKEGVSSFDIRAVGDICTKLQGIGLDVKMAPSLEAYGPASFTQSRSMLNERISQEGIGQTIIQTIKAWIQSLIEFIIKTIRWVQNLKHADDRIAAKVDRAIGVIREVQKNTEAVRKWNPRPLEHSLELKEITKELLSSGEVKRTEATLAAFGTVLGSRKVLTIHKDAKAGATMIAGEINLLHQYISTGVKPDTMGISTIANTMRTLTDAVKQARGMMEENPSTDYLHTNVQYEQFEQIFLQKQRESYKYEFLMDTYRTTADALRKLKDMKVSSDNPAVLEDININIQTMTLGLNNLSELVTFFSELNKTQARVLKLYIRYHHKKYTLTLNDTLANAPGNHVKVAVEKLGKSTRDLFASLGL